MVKILQASDIHIGNNPYRFKAIAELANKQAVDGVFLLGDFVRGGKYLAMALKGKKRESEILSRELTPRELENLEINREIQEQGLEGLTSTAVSEDIPLRARRRIKHLLDLYSERKDEIRASAPRYQQAVNRRLQELAKAAQETIQQIAEKSEEDYGVIDDILAEINAPVFGVAGNHDPLTVYGMRNITFVERQEQPVELKGLRIVASVNSYEKISGTPQQLYPHLGIDRTEKELAQFIRRYGTEEDLERWYESNREWQRLRDLEDVDILLTHKGLDSLAESSEQSNHSFGSGVARFMRENQIPMAFCGHIHSGLFTDEHGYQGLRSSDKRVYVVEINERTKEIDKIIVYKWKRNPEVWQRAKEVDKEDIERYKKRNLN